MSSTDLKGVPTLIVGERGRVNHCFKYPVSLQIDLYVIFFTIKISAWIVTKVRPVHFQHYSIEAVLTFDRQSEYARTSKYA